MVTWSIPDDDGGSAYRVYDYGLDHFVIIFAVASGSLGCGLNGVVDRGEHLRVDEVQFTFTPRSQQATAVSYLLAHPGVAVVDAGPFNVYDCIREARMTSAAVGGTGSGSCKTYDGRYVVYRGIALQLVEGAAIRLEADMVATVDTDSIILVRYTRIDPYVGTPNSCGCGSR
jgi:hypothetical protein